MELGKGVELFWNGFPLVSHVHVQSDSMFYPEAIGFVSKRLRASLMQVLYFQCDFSKLLKTGKGIEKHLAAIASPTVSKSPRQGP
jgi:hypothetical protein